MCIYSTCVCNGMDARMCMYIIHTCTYMYVMWDICTTDSSVCVCVCVCVPTVGMCTYNVHMNVCVLHFTHTHMTYSIAQGQHYTLHHYILLPNAYTMYMCIWRLQCEMINRFCTTCTHKHTHTFTLYNFSLD